MAEIVEQTVAIPQYAVYHEAYARRLLMQSQDSG